MFVNISIRVNKVIIAKNKVLPRETKRTITLAKGRGDLEEEAARINSNETRDLEKFARDQGTDLFGVADLKLFRPFGKRSIEW
jgi:hypothetical protein